MDFQTLDCDKIVFPGPDDTSRSFRKEVAEGLALSIEAEGLYYPIAVRANPAKPGSYLGVHGRHRLHAQHRILRRPTILCNVLVMDDDEAAIAAVAENTFRKALSQREKAKALIVWLRLFAAKHPERVGRGKAGLAAMQALKDAGKAAGAAGGHGASDRKTQGNRKTSGNRRSAGSTTAPRGEGQKANLDLRANGRGAGGAAATMTEPDGEDQKANLDLRAAANGQSAVDETKDEGKPANFAETVAAATGCSESTAKRELRVAQNLTDEQLRVCEERNLCKGQVDSIAGIKDTAQRARVIDRIDAGLDFDDAWRQVEPDARKATGKSRDREDAEAAAGQETRPELSDDEWFDQTCGAKAASLGDPAGFQADALVYRRVTGPRHLFLVGVKGTLNDAQAAKVTGPFHDLVRRFVSAGHPKDWPLCGGCGGSGRAGDRGDAGCTTCRGAGYLLEGPPGGPTTGAGGDREDRTAAPVKEPVTTLGGSEAPPDGGRACGGEPGRSDTIDPGEADFEAAMAAMFDAPEE